MFVEVLFAGPHGVVEVEVPEEDGASEKGVGRESGYRVDSRVSDASCTPLLALGANKT